jgi:uncharacterized membrane protein
MLKCVNVIILFVNCVILFQSKKVNFVITNNLKNMENKYIKNLQLSVENIHLNLSEFNEKNVHIGGKWLTYSLMATALILWVVFNVTIIQSYQIPPYLLVIVNLILYCIIAIMVNSDSYSDAKKL